MGAEWSAYREDMLAPARTAAARDDGPDTVHINEATRSFVDRRRPSRFVRKSEQVANEPPHEHCKEPGSAMRGLPATIKRILPAALLERVRLTRPKTWRDARGIAPVRDYVRLLRLIDARSQPPGQPIALRVDLVGRRRITLRPGTTDVTVLFDTMHGYHLPPDHIDPTTIVDLG